MTLRKPTPGEDEYFAREDAEKKRQLALARAQHMAVAERQRLAEAHHDHCPQCGHVMHSIGLRHVQALRCFACQGIFLSQAHLAHLNDDPSCWAQLLNFFTQKDYGVTKSP